MRNVLKNIARRIVRKFIPAPPQPFMPADFEKLVEAFQSSGVAARRLISQNLMQRLLLQPADGIYLRHQSCRTRFGHSDIYSHAQISIAFANGEFDGAERQAAALAIHSPLPFHFWLWSRTCAAQGSLTVALEIVQGGLSRFGPDLDLQIELASLLNLLGRVSEANAALSAVSLDDLPDYGYPKGVDIYTDEYVRRMWWQYWAHFIRHSAHQFIDSSVVEIVPARLVRFLRMHNVRTLVDFGTLCGEAMYRVASAAPSVNVIGVDRQPIIKVLNDENYHMKNLTFREGDVFDEIKRAHQGPVALTHTRTAVCCDSDLVDRIYKTCRDRGVRHIIGCEMSGISRESGTFPDYDTLQTSILFRGTMTMHPYRKMLESASYRVIRLELIPFAVLFDDPGMHLVYFEAELTT